MKIDLPNKMSSQIHASRYDLTVIVPVFNEQNALIPFHNALCKSLAAIPGESIQIIYINDGSRDLSWETMRSLHCSFADVSRINLSRNFGKEAAMAAGLDHALGDAVAILDADLQDPPELLHNMLLTLRSGFDVVNMKRRNRNGESVIKSFCAKQHYRIMQWLSDSPIEADVGDFRMLSRRVVNAINQLPEKNRYTKGIMSWPGYKQTTIMFDRPERRTGKTKWSFSQLCDLALSGITAFSIKPLRLATILGALISVIALAYGSWIFAKTLVYGESVAGFPSLILVILFMGSVQLLGIGILGEYLGKIFIESKGRPLYLIMDTDNAPAKNLPAKQPSHLVGKRHAS